VSYSNNEIKLETSTSAPGYLVLSEVYYPGWKVEVDGRPAGLKRANYAFRAVFLPSGEHHVRFHFQSRSGQLGMACSLFVWGALAVTAFRPIVSRWQSALRTSRARGKLEAS
jgi:uncharacterized membrane protein YfhO